MSGSRLLITNSTINIDSTPKSNAWHLLFNHTTSSAFDNTDEHEQMKCHPGTRTVLLDRLESWVSAPINLKRLLKWLEGPMGSGKTALARTMVDRTSMKGQLIGSFIFSRTVPGRNTEHNLITTLAYQLGISIPLARPFIEAQINNDPSVLHKSLHAQLESLILNPLRQMRQHTPNLAIEQLPHLIIIDGLDECGSSADGDDARQLKVLDILSRLVQSQDVIPVLVLVHCRPEPHIKGWMAKHSSFACRISLGSALSPDNDIRLFVTHTFIWLRDNHYNRHLLPNNWPENIRPRPCDPGYSVISFIVERSSGQFIYAAVAMKFIGSERHNPAERLSMILNGGDPTQGIISPMTPQSILDGLFHHIFQEASCPSMALRVLAFHFCCPTNSITYEAIKKPILPVSTIGQILSFNSVEQMEHCMQDFEALFLYSRYPLVTFHHVSISEFLQDKRRARELYISRERYAPEFACAALKCFQKESYIGTQCSLVSIIEALCSISWDLTMSDLLAHDIRAEIWRLVSGPFNRSVQRYMDKITNGFPSVYLIVRTFIAKTVRTVPSPLELPLTLRSNGKNTQPYPNGERNMTLRCLNSKFMSLIEPHISPYISSPSLFSVYLHWVFELPIDPSNDKSKSSLSGTSTPPHHWPIHLRDQFLLLGNKLTVFPIPSHEFLHESLIIMLENSVLSVRSQALCRFTEYYRRRLFVFLAETLQYAGLSMKLPRYLMNSDSNTLTPFFRQTVQACLYLRSALTRSELYLPPMPYGATPATIFDIALVTYFSHDFSPWTTIETSLIRMNDRTVLIPGISLIGLTDWDFERNVSKNVDESVARINGEVEIEYWPWWGNTRL